MRVKFNLDLQMENENTGEIIRNTKVDIYMNSLDDCSTDYLMECIISACNSTVDIIKDIK